MLVGREVGGARPPSLLRGRDLTGNSVLLGEAYFRYDEFPPEREVKGPAFTTRGVNTFQSGEVMN